MFVYIVIGDDLTAAFTVKHELCAWLRRQEDTSALRVFRCRDNPGIYEIPVNLSITSLIGAAPEGDAVYR